MKTLTYAPWVPRAGMAGMFRHLVAAWGNPNNGHTVDAWPRNVLENVCERGTPIPIVFDQYCDMPVLDYSTAFVEVFDS